MLAFVAQIALLLGYGVLLYGLFSLWTYVQQHCSSALPLLEVIPPLSFVESIRLVLVFLVLMEATHLCFFYFKRLFGSPRLACVHLYGAITGGLQRFPAVKLHAGSDPQENHVSTDPSDSHGSNAIPAEDHSREEESDDESEGWTKKLMNAFWILFQYSKTPRCDAVTSLTPLILQIVQIFQDLIKRHQLRNERMQTEASLKKFLKIKDFSQSA